MKRKKLISECNYPWGEFSPTHAINHYLGCAYNCPYCWARDIWWARMGKHLSSVWGVPDDFVWHQPIPFDGIRDMILSESARLTENDRVLLCSVTDPYPPEEGLNRLTRYILDTLAARKAKVIILTKAGQLPRRDFDLMAQMKAWFGVTLDCNITSAAAAQGYDFWPLGSNSYSSRMATLVKASRFGLNTFASLEPWVPGVDAREIVRWLARYVDHWIVGPLNYRGVDHSFYQRELPHLIRLFQAMGISYYIKPDLMRCLKDNFKVPPVDSGEAL